MTSDKLNPADTIHDYCQIKYKLPHLDLAGIPPDVDDLAPSELKQLLQALLGENAGRSGSC